MSKFKVSFLFQNEIHSIEAETSSDGFMESSHAFDLCMKEAIHIIDIKKTQTLLVIMKIERI